ncbi:hypothetical protein [Prochlorothrix hollandica]|uniref:hypothetical protein n=1 Tax=Prochlorothrix hollandica TaxID=1223 RepID=UPI000361E5EE|nr:hypothetical protein [Prochlorothrix hollandica]
MTEFVVDTNVLISANGRHTHASLQCQLHCIEFISTYRKITISIDQLGLIMEEYAKHLNYSGEPGVGDEFFKYLHDYQYCDPLIHRVQIGPETSDDSRGFQELPLNSMDPSDRKFLAVAVVARAIIVNATDSDWAEQEHLLKSLNIAMRELCPDRAQRR